MSIHPPCLPLIKNRNNPILIGFSWRGGLFFSYGTRANKTYLDLDLYDIYFAIAPSLTSSISLVPTITKYINIDGFATFEFSADQTATMSSGLWIGQSFLQLISDPVPTYKAQLEICVIDPVPMP